MSRASEVYDLILDRAAGSGAVNEVIIGLTWTLCGIDDGGCGLAMSPATPTRTLPWPGTLAGRQAADISGWLREWEPYAACVGMAAANAVINGRSPLIGQAIPLHSDGAGNLAVFEHFAPRLAGKNVVVVGRYPGLEAYAGRMRMTVLERNPTAADLPDPAAEFLLPEADWVFLTASSLTNKTFPRLAELSRDANLVLMGPTTPWLPELAEFGVDFLAGVTVRDASLLRRTVAEGGGVRIFEAAVGYAVHDLRSGEMDALKDRIAGLAVRRRAMKGEMEAWYAAGKAGFPGRSELERLDAELSALDTHYKRLWDARFGRTPGCGQGEME